MDKECAVANSHLFATLTKRLLALYNSLQSISALITLAERPVRNPSSKNVWQQCVPMVFVQI